MPPCLSSELASQPKSTILSSVWCDHFGLRMTKILPLESSRFPPAAEPDNTAMLPGRVANLMMHWVKRWFHLWQNFSGALMKAILMGIPKEVCRLAAAALLKKARIPLGEKEELGRDKSEMEDTESINKRRKQNRRWRDQVDHQWSLILSSLERWSQEDLESLIKGRQFFTGAKTDKMDLEDHAAFCLIHHSISFDSENDSESSSDEDMGLEDLECSGSFLQKSVEGLAIEGYFEDEGRDSCSPCEKFGDFENDLEGDSWQSVESPSVSQESRGSVEDFVMFKEPSMESTPDFAKDGQYLSQCGKAKENMGTPTVSCGLKSSLVLSLFYSPSEEDDDDDDDSEDWASEDKIEETSQSCLDGAVLENGNSSSATEDNSKNQGFPEKPCGSCIPSVDPLHSLSFSKSIQPATSASPEPKKHKEITVSFYIRKEDSKPEEICNLPKPSPPKDRRSVTGHSRQQCCQRGMERNCDLVTTETSLGSQKECQNVKKVRFSPKVTVHKLVVWNYASRAARRGPWEEMARDRCRFQRRIAEVGAILEPCLQLEHRAKAWRKIHGDLDFVPQGNPEYTLHSSAGREKLCVSEHSCE